MRFGCVKTGFDSRRPDRKFGETKCSCRVRNGNAGGIPRNFGEIVKTGFPARRASLAEAGGDSQQPDQNNWRAYSGSSMKKISLENFWKVWRRAAMVGAVLFLLVVFFWGVERSLPGGLLYPIKIGIFEKIIGWLAFSDKAKLANRIDVLDTRLSEALSLVNGSGITPKNRTKIEALFTEQFSATKNLIDGLQAKGDVAGAAHAASLLEVSLSGYETIFLEVRVRQTDAKDQIDSLGAKISDARPVIQAMRSALESRLASLGDEQSIKKAAEVEAGFADEATLAAEEFAAGMNLSTEAASQNSARIAVAKDLLSQGKDKLEAGEPGLAFVLFSQSFRVAESEILTLRIRNSLAI